MYRLMTIHNALQVLQDQMVPYAFPPSSQQRKYPQELPWMHDTVPHASQEIQSHPGLIALAGTADLLRPTLLSL